MILVEKLDKALAIGIFSGATRDYDSNDLLKLMKSHTILEQAKDAFLSQEINFEEYISLCESHQVNVDLYMETIESNLTKLKLI